MTALRALLLLVAAAVFAHSAPGPRGSGLRELGAGVESGLQADAGPRRRLQAAPAQVPTDPSSWPKGATYIPAGGKGSFESGGSTGIIMAHAMLMKDGQVVGWSTRYHGLQEYSSATWDPETRTHEQLLDNCGIHDCKNSFCGAQTTTASGDALLFGGHAGDLQWFRSYHHEEGYVWSMLMPSGRWYPGVATLPDGQVLVVGGVADSGSAGYGGVEHSPEVDNPSHTVYDPVAKRFSADQYGMWDQLHTSFPVHTYPHVVVLPSGNVAVSAGKKLVNYKRTGKASFEKVFSYQSRPGPPWSYPQTGQGVPLPLFPPYSNSTKMFFLAAGGSAWDRAEMDTPASDAAQVIELSGGAGAAWREVGPMPDARVMGDAVILCDGTIGFFGGADEGIAGWAKEQMTVEYGDGGSWFCKEKCSKARRGWLYEPSIFDPATGKWSAKGSLARALRPRLYHATALLLPDCTVMLAGSDVTWDQTAEIFSPPYLSLGPRPAITSAPSAAAHGQELAVGFASADPVDRALLLRTGSATHSMPFDARALWLEVLPSNDAALTVRIPGTANVLPPGLYMLVLLSNKGAPSKAHLMSIAAPSPGQQVPTVQAGPPPSAPPPPAPKPPASPRPAAPSPAAPEPSPPASQPLGPSPPPAPSSGGSGDGPVEAPLPLEAPPRSAAAAAAAARLAAAVAALLLGAALVL